MPEMEVPQGSQAPRRLSSARLAVAAAIVLGLPLAGLTYKLGAPRLTSLFKETPIRDFMVVTPEGAAQHASLLVMPSETSSRRGSPPKDSTAMIAREAQPNPPAAAPPSSLARPAPVPEKPKAPLHAPPAPAAVPKTPAKPPWPHLRVKSFRQQEAERQPTMFLMNVGPQNPQPPQQMVPAQTSQTPSPAPAQPAQLRSVPKTALPAPAVAPAPTKKKVEPIPLVPRPRADHRQLGQVAVTPQTSVGNADPARFQDAAPGPPFPAASGAATVDDPGHTTFIGAPDLPPKPNPLTSGPAPVPLHPAPRTDNRQPGQAPSPPGP